MVQDFCRSVYTCIKGSNMEMQFRKNDKTSKMTCAPSEDSDQTGHPHSMIRAFAVRMKNPCGVLGYPLSAQRAKTLIRLGGCWAQRLVCWLRHAAAHLYAPHVCAPVRMGCGLRVGEVCKISQTISVRPDHMRTTWTLCIRSEFSYRSEQQYDMYSRICLCQ